MVSAIYDVEFTLEEISEVLNIPKETCRQVLLMALRKLSSSKNREKLEEIAELLMMIEEK
ncbi:MAG: sigma factor-like helix-turn-helix DNA-binding protein [Sulfuricurvum sp.]|nr:sigma factor-like helix-turn-helix DNA-binding protein [Sulfuricurvum sp.]